jgi:predicted O-methyltransferase YrrM
MLVDLKAIKRMIKQAQKEPDTGDPWLEQRYQDDIPIIGHTNEYYKLFYALAKRFKPRLTVELGSYRGVAAAHFAAGNPKGKVITIDIHKDDKVAMALAEDAAAHYDNLEYINGWTWDDDVVAQVKAAGPIDILFMDAWHEYQYDIIEKEKYFPLLADEALVIVDDVFDMEGATVDMVKFWKEMEGEKFLNTSLHKWIPMGYLRYLRDE